MGLQENLSPIGVPVPTGVEQACSQQTVLNQAGALPERTEPWYGGQALRWGDRREEAELLCQTKLLTVYPLDSGGHLSCPRQIHTAG